MLYNVFVWYSHGQKCLLLLSIGREKREGIRFFNEFLLSTIGLVFFLVVCMSPFFIFPWFFLVKLKITKLEFHWVFSPHRHIKIFENIKKCRSDINKNLLVVETSGPTTINEIIIPQKSFSYIKLLWINELFILFPGKMNYEPVHSFLTIALALVLARFVKSWHLIG